MPFRDLGSCGGKSRIGEDKKSDQPCLIPSGGFDHCFVWPVLSQRIGILRSWLDMDAAPAFPVKRLANGVDDRMLRANIKVTPRLDMLKGTPQDDVLKVRAAPNPKAEKRQVGNKSVSTCIIWGWRCH